MFKNLPLQEANYPCSGFHEFGKQIDAFFPHSGGEQYSNVKRPQQKLFGMSIVRAA